MMLPEVLIDGYRDSPFSIWSGFSVIFYTLTIWSSFSMALCTFEQSSSVLNSDHFITGFETNYIEKTKIESFIM